MHTGVLPFLHRTQLRARKAGLGTDDLVSGPKKYEKPKKKKKKQQAKEAAYGLQVQEPKKKKVEKLESLLGGTFTNQQVDEEEENPDM